MARHVPRWRDGHMALRRTAAGMLEAKKTFRKLKGRRLMPMLSDALQRHQEKSRNPKVLGSQATVA